MTSCWQGSAYPYFFEHHIEDFAVVLRPKAYLSVYTQQSQHVAHQPPAYCYIENVIKLHSLICYLHSDLYIKSPS